MSDKYKAEILIVVDGKRQRIDLKCNDKDFFFEQLHKQIDDAR